MPKFSSPVQKEAIGVKGDVTQIDIGTLVILDEKKLRENPQEWKEKSERINSILERQGIPKLIGEKAEITPEQEKIVNKAEKAVRKVLRIFGKPTGDIDLFLRLGWKAYSHKLIDPAIEWFEKALEIDPQNTDALKNMGIVLMEKERNEEAIQYLEAVLKIDPEDIDGWKFKAKALEKLDRYQDAIACYDMALSIDPERTDMWNNKGICLDKNKEHKKAIECFNKALEIDNNIPQIWNNKGVSYCYMKEHKKAIECFNKALEIDNNIPQIWNNKGVCLEEMGNFDEAKKCYEKALELLPPEEPLYDFIEKNREITSRLMEGKNA